MNPNLKFEKKKKIFLKNENKKITIIFRITNPTNLIDVAILHGLQSGLVHRRTGE